MKNELINKAMSAREHAYAPYSGFKVGAAILCGDGTVISGFNIENVSYPATMCAERTALYSALAQGKRDFKAIAIIGSSKEPCYPCGVCRQVFAEFCDKNFVFYICSEDGSFVEKTFEEIMPFTFSFTTN
ncbi:MAG: cytidine deaminase [Ruminococcaceae bacterium]|nr:cytidine deaminase [Oscillospiraceae bacterium]